MNNDENNTTILEKIKKIFKKNPAASITASLVALKVVGIFALCIIVVALMYAVISFFSTFFGIFEKDLTSGKYKDKSIKELQTTEYGNCYRNAYGNWFAGTWQEIIDWFGTGTNSTCELIELIDKKVKDAEKEYSDYGLELSPGLIVSTIIYGYAHQPSVEGEDLVSAEPTQILQDIVEGNILKESDIDEMIDAMIMEESYWYYTCDSSKQCTSTGGKVTEDTKPEDIKRGRICKKALRYDVRFSREKYAIFLRYGKDVAASYEAAYNHNQSIMYTCASCYVEFENDTNYVINTDVEKYNKKADYNSDVKDDLNINITDEEYSIYSKEIESMKGNVPSVADISYEIDTSKTYTYEDGFIFNKFPNYKKAFDSGVNIKNDIYTPKNIEKSIDSMFSYEDTENKIYGKDDISEESKGLAKSELSISTKTECPSTEGCDCKNGNLTPDGGFGIGSFTHYDGETCKYLLNPSETQVRMISCICKPEYDSSYNFNVDFAGGASKTKVEGCDVYMAKNSISLEQYVKMMAITEMNASDPVESLKFQMLLGQTNAMRIVNTYGRFTSSGEIILEAGSCFQNAKMSRYNSYYNRYKDNIDKAYEEIKDKILIDGSTNAITYTRYASEFQKAFRTFANEGYSYVDILASDYVRNYRANYYADATIKTCSNEESGSLTVDGEGTKVGTTGEYPLMAADKGAFKGFSYNWPDHNDRAININPAWKRANLTTVSINCNGLSKKWTVHKLAKKQFEEAAKKLCQITSTGIDGIKYSASDIQIGGAQVSRNVSNSTAVSLHAYGIAVDINTNLSVNVNGKTYTPYGRGNSELSEYYSFIQALGGESDKRNVNYILWKKIFQPLGFKWGGNWGRSDKVNGTYDGMHFEIDWRQTE